MAEARNFNTAYQKMIDNRSVENWIKAHPDSITLDELFQFMLIKGKMGTFQSFDPKDFGANYDLVPIPRDGTPEAEYWFGRE